ncbi:MAG: hypothetical protein E7037_07575 [Verrucomicrobia bacterium]|nr:hypothetical protein [Verrucomicrobiota bacterium]
MKNYLIALGIASLVCVPAIAENEYGDYVKTPDIVAADLWKDSWQLGKEYQHLATFEIDAAVKASSRKDASWLEKLCGMAYEDISGHMQLGGTTSAFTTVAHKTENGETLLVRNFGTTDLQPNFYFEIKDSPVVGFVMKTLMTDGEIKTLVNKRLTEAIAVGAGIKAGIAAFLAAEVATIGASGGSLGTVAATEALAAAYASTKAALIAVAKSTDAGGRLEEYVQGKLQDAGLGASELDGEVVYTVRNKSKAGKLFGSLNTKANFALKLAESFNNRDYLIFSDKGGNVSSKRISSKTIEDLMELSENGQLSQNIGALKNLDGAVASDAESCFKRESLGLNEKILGGKERKIGEVWLADADFMNSFLHPELKGKFKGRVLLKYESDTRAQDYWGNFFSARKLIMLRRSGDDSTNAAYEEEEFSLSLNGQRTSLEIFLDKETLVVREVRLKAESDVSAGGLPNSIFTRGLKLNGDIECNMNYHCRESSTDNG